MLAHSFYVEKMKNTKAKRPSSYYGPGLKLLAFGLNHVGVLGDDAKKVIAKQATVLARQGSYSLGTAKTHPSYPHFDCPSFL